MSITAIGAAGFETCVGSTQTVDQGYVVERTNVLNEAVTVEPGTVVSMASHGSIVAMAAFDCYSILK